MTDSAQALPRRDEAPDSGVARRGLATAARMAPPVLALAAGLASLGLPLAWAGLWAPYELDVADLSRRIAVALHGAQLDLPGAQSAVPTLTELGKGQLPFSSVAVGFQLFGLGDWTGRLPLAAWGGLGLAATYALVARFVDRVAGLYATLVLATTPLFYLHARTMLGDGVTLCAVALATWGLTVGTFDTRAGPAARAGWLTLGALGLLAGFACRGAWLGVACPALGVGLAWVAVRSAARGGLKRRANDVAGLVCLTLGLAALAAGSFAHLRGSPELYLELMGASLQPPSKLPTHDAVLHQLGFGLYPWSAVAPFAMALCLARATSMRTEAIALVTSLGSLVAVSLALHGLGSAQQSETPFVGTFAVAALTGIGFRWAESSSVRPRLLALGAAALLILFYVDLRTMPEQTLRPFTVGSAQFPDSFKDNAHHWLKYGSLITLPLVCLSLGDLCRRNYAAWSRRGDAMRWLQGLRRGWSGRLPWLLVGLTALLLLPAAASQLERLGVAVPGVARWGGWRRPMELGFLLIPIVVATPVVGYFLRDATTWLASLLPQPRARVGVFAMAAFGFAMSLGYYTALAGHLSPRNVFEVFTAQSGPDEPLAVIGQAARVAPYYTPAEVYAPKSPRQAFDWLTAKPEQRRWLVFDAKHLAQLNQLYRARANPVRHLPIVDASSSEIFLASSVLAADENDQNPLAAWISDAKPASPQHPLDVDLEGKLRCHGWSITHPDGSAADQVRAGRPYQFRIYWEVTGAVGGNWKTFIHVDANGRRFNGDHDTLQGKYPPRFWREGDWITDVSPLELEGHYAGSTYQVYFGLFSGSKRLHVTRGAHHENRIRGGKLTVH